MIMVERLRAEVPQPEADELRVEEARLMAAIADSRPVRRGFSLPRRVVVPLLAAAGTAVALAGGGIFVDGDQPKGSVVHVMPASSVEVLKRAADNAARRPELHPRPGQFMVFESVAMSTVEAIHKDSQERYLSRSRRKVWLPVEGTSVQGVIVYEKLAPRQWPGWPLPPQAREGVGVTGEPERLADFDQRPQWAHTDYASLSRLPTDPAKMYQHLFRGLGNDEQANRDAWQRVMGMLNEAYMPAAQRAALYRAAAAIPGVTTVPQAEDAAGRKGIAAAMTIKAMGVREEYIFDPRTYQYLGERTVVVDSGPLKTPVGSVLTASALLKVSVADNAPAPRR
ncbi:CU044_5270 family protein [Actinomadura pelletieri]|nr:CU044_5270 family protein [Actinomadura pelletieri]